MNRKRLLLALLILSLALASPGCDDSDPSASSGSTITVAANPRNIPLELAGRFPSTISAIFSYCAGSRLAMRGEPGGSMWSWSRWPAIPWLFDTTNTTGAPIRAAVSTSIAARI